jgi:hypothetical protein
VTGKQFSLQLILSMYTELAAFEGIPSKTNVELDLMTRYFIFLVTVSASSYTEIVPDIAYSAHLLRRDFIVWSD